MNATELDILIKYADKKSTFKFAELLCYLQDLRPTSKSNLTWHSRELIKENKLYMLGRGIYTNQLQNTTQYLSTLRKKAINIGEKLSMAFPYITESVFDDQILSDLQHHVSTNNAIYIEVEKDVLEPVFHYLKKTGRSIYLNPSKDFVYEYIDMSKDVIIVMPLISEAPSAKCEGVITPTLEKINVDILCDDDLDYLHGTEWFYILENTFTILR